MKRFAVLVATICLFVVPSAALANSTCQQYSSQACAASTVSSHEPTTAASTTQTLPFTGLDVGWLAGGGLTLLGAGLVVRRVSRRLN